MKSFNHLGMELRALFNVIRRNRIEFTTKCTEEPGTTLHMRTITYLHMHQKEDVFQRDLEKEFEVRRSTATKFLQLMEQNGLIERHAVDYDARLKKITLTEKGNERFRDAMHVLEAFEQRMSAGLTQEEIEQFIITLRKIKQNLE